MLWNWLDPLRSLNRELSNIEKDQHLLGNRTNIKSFNVTSSSLDDISPTKSFAPWAKGRPKPVGPPKICITTASIVVGLNIILTIVAFGVGYSKYSPNGFVTVPLYIGNCSTSKNWSIGLHVLINALGTAMLAASNYCAQYLAAPTREDVDRAHSQGTWVDIGIPSVRNIWRMKSQHTLLWVVLMLTSLPNHLIYNSVILNSKSSNEYNIMVGPSDYDRSKPLDISDEVASCFPEKLGQSYSQFKDEFNAGNYKILTKQQCMDRLAVNFPSGQGTVMIVSKNLTSGDKFPFASVGVGNPIKEISMDLPSYQWMCPLTRPTGCPIVEMKHNIEHWSVSAVPWIAPEWIVTIPTRNGQMVTYQRSNFTGCPDQSIFDDYCYDLNNIGRLAWGYGGSTAHKFNNTLHDASGWQDPSWAAAVRFEQVNATCRPPGSSMSVGDMGDSYTVDSCLSMSVDESCQLLFIPSFAIVVIACGVIKLACITFIARRASPKKLLTVGDAIVSFLTNPDPYTTERCLTTKRDWSTGSSTWHRKEYHLQMATHSRILSTKRKFWWQAGSPFLWTMTVLLCSVTLGVAGYLLSQGLNDNKIETIGGSGIQTLWDLGLGTMSFATTLANIKTSMMANVLLANVPQLVVSISYYFQNALVTSMMVSAEYDRYAIGSPAVDSFGNPTMRPNKPLRVTNNAEGAQRRSYFLGLPFRYGLTFMTSYAVLHWLVSQSLFYIRVLFYDVHGRYVESADVNVCGWSPMAIILAITLGGFITLVPFVLGMRRFRSPIPLAASCSAAISAACHPPRSDPDAALRNIVWGEIVTAPSSMQMVPEERALYHCSFTSREVRVPSVGKYYV